MPASGGLPADPAGPGIAYYEPTIDANGWRSTGYTRELYLECPEDRACWVTELQEPVVQAG
ncbi:hypothetical protein ABH930_005636 [Kitasatospora sp. GAS204A]|nr:hypothetical protein [Kitasatospora sp. GAS204B]